VAKRQRQHIKSRSRRVAAAAARRALLLEELALARVQARSRIVRLPLRLSIAGRAKSRRYLTVPVDVEGGWNPGGCTPPSSPPTPHILTCRALTNCIVSATLC
jgi:hypothetical protein